MVSNIQIRNKDYQNALEFLETLGSLNWAQKQWAKIWADEKTGKIGLETSKISRKVGSFWHATLGKWLSRRPILRNVDELPLLTNCNLSNFFTVDNLIKKKDLPEYKDKVLFAKIKKCLENALEGVEKLKATYEKKTEKLKHIYTVESQLLRYQIVLLEFLNNLNSNSSNIFDLQKRVSDLTQQINIKDTTISSLQETILKMNELVKSLSEKIEEQNKFLEEKEEVLSIYEQKASEGLFNNLKVISKKRKKLEALEKKEPIAASSSSSKEIAQISEVGKDKKKSMPTLAEIDRIFDYFNSYRYGIRQKICVVPDSFLVEYDYAASSMKNLSKVGNYLKSWLRYEKLWSRDITDLLKLIENLAPFFDTKDFLDMSAPLAYHYYYKASEAIKGLENYKKLYSSQKSVDAIDTIIGYIKQYRKNFDSLTIGIVDEKSKFIKMIEDKKKQLKEEKERNEALTEIIQRQMKRNQYLLSKLTEIKK